MEWEKFPYHSEKKWINNDGDSLTKNSKHHENIRLFLRLPGDDSQPLLWRLVSPGDIQYGSVAAGEISPQLASLSTRYACNVLVPASEITFHRVTVPYRSWRKRLQMLPFILEEKLATDIENLHFAVLQQNEDICDVAVVEKEVMRNWLAHCKQLGIRDQIFLPDVLMLPLTAEGWSAVHLNEQWLFRCSAHSGMVVEDSWLPQLLAISAPPIIECYSTPPVQCMGIEWRTQSGGELLQLMAEKGEYRGADLRQGEFSRKGALFAEIRPWRSVICALMAYVLLLCLEASLTHYRLWQQSVHWQQASVRFYQQLFPGEKNVINPRAQMMKHLQLSPVENQTRIGTIMRQLQQLRAETPDIRLQTLVWDGRRKELKIDLQATSFQSLEKFQLLAGKKYHLQPGEIRQNTENVESRIILGVTDE
ncbi:type II secretion system protein GspL [Escherichia coli]